MTPRDFSEMDIHLALDGELPEEDRADYEAWLKAHPEMQAKAENLAADQTRLRQALPDLGAEEIPSRLASVLSAPAREKLEGGWSFGWAAAGAAALLLIGGAGGYFIGSTRMVPPEPVQAETSEVEIADAAIAAHVVYAAEKLHVVEVGADQEDHLERWLSNRTGLSITAPDLSSQGLVFVGGRLLPAVRGTAAQLMYQDNLGNRVSLYMTRDESGLDTGFRQHEGHGAKALYWLESGYGCALVGKLPDKQLDAAASSAYRQLLHTYKR